jgi:hypothetical protein
MIPVLRAQPPRNFHARGEVSCERRHREADEPHEWHYVVDLDGPKTEAVLVEVRLDARDHGVTVPAG